MAHSYQRDEDEVPVGVVDFEAHDFEKVHGEQREGAGKGDEEDDSGKGVPDLLLHQVLRHDGVAQPAGSQDS